MKNIFVLIFFITLTTSWAQEKYVETLFYRIEIDLNEVDLSVLFLNGIELCHSHKTDRNTLITEVSGIELNRLGEYQQYIEVLITDMTQYYQKRISDDMKSQNIYSLRSSKVDQFALGTMGGMKTLDEIIDDLDSMAVKFPHLITNRFSIGKSYEDRDIWVVLMGTEMDSKKPMVMYNSLIHAREPACMMTVIYYMWWLLENYGVDDEATFILDNRHLAFIPVLNPDGYEFNRMVSPEGGGLHRKNMRPVGDEFKGVDLNRNFGPKGFWDHMSGGSSINPNSNSYRGEAPFSEPETQALKTFVEAFDFKTAFNYHSFSNLLIYPYGVTDELPEDGDVFINYANDLTSENGYLAGTAIETVGYKVRGVADDWFYGPVEGNENGRLPIISFTPEVGSRNDGFWPAPSRIITLCEENLQANKFLARFAGPELVTHPNEMPLANVSQLSSGSENRLSFVFNDIHNYGRTQFEGAKWRLSTEDKFVDILIDEHPFGNLLPNDYVSGQTADFLVNITNEKDTSVNFILELIVPGSFKTGTWEYNIPVKGVTTSTQNEVHSNDMYKIISLAPQPFNNQTKVTFELKKETEINFSLLNMNGVTVYTSGKHLYPKGKNDWNIKVESLNAGTYILQMRAGHYIFNQRVVKL